MPNPPVGFVLDPRYPTRVPWGGLNVGVWVVHPDDNCRAVQIDQLFLPIGQHVRPLIPLPSRPLPPNQRWALCPEASVSAEWLRINPEAQACPGWVWGTETVGTSAPIAQLEGPTEGEAETVAWAIVDPRPGKGQRPEKVLWPHFDDWTPEEMAKVCKWESEIQAICHRMEGTPFDIRPLVIRSAYERERAARLAAEARADVWRKRADELEAGLDADHAGAEEIIADLTDQRDESHRECDRLSADLASARDLLRVSNREIIDAVEGLVRQLPGGDAIVSASRSDLPTDPHRDREIAERFADPDISAGSVELAALTGEGEK